MQYFSAKELKENRDKVKERMTKFNGPTIRHGFGLRVFEKYAGSDKNSAILDCGTAAGGFIEDLHRSGFKNLYGLDIDNYLAAGKEKLLKEFKTVDLSFDKIPWPDNFFKVLTAWCLVPHLENPYNFFREAFRVLDKDGLLIVSLINVASPPNRKYFKKHGNFPAYHKKNNHIAILTPAVFEKTALKYFDFVGREYFITPRIFNGIQGRLRKFSYNLSSHSAKLKTYLENRWGAKEIDILMKK